MKTRGGQGRRALADHWLTFPAGNGVSGWDAEVVLRRVGIPVIGRRYAHRPGDDYGLKVRGSQAQWAEYNLCRAGFALSSRLLNPAHGKMKTAALPPTWNKPARPHGVNGWFVWLVALFFAGDWTKGKATASTKRNR